MDDPLDLANAPDVRPFPVPRLLNDAQKFLAAVPADKKAAILFYVDQNEAGAAYMARLPRGWSLMANTKREWKSGDFEGRVALVKYL